MINGSDDIEVVSQCLHGRPEAFRVLVDRYYKVIFNIAYRISRNVQDAEDITQSVFTKVFEKLHTYNRDYRFFSWIYRISVNEALNHVERYSRNTELMDDKMESSISPEEGASGSDIREMIDDALMEMELDYRVLIVLKHFHDLSYREMAYVVDIPEKKVKSRLFAARQILKERLIKKGIDFHG